MLMSLMVQFGCKNIKTKSFISIFLHCRINDFFLLKKMRDRSQCRIPAPTITMVLILDERAQNVLLAHGVDQVF